MTDIPTILAWLKTLSPRNSVAVDDGGLTLVEINVGSNSSRPTGAYLEIGGIPDEVNCPVCNAPSRGPVPPYCRKHHGDYMAFLVSNNCD